MENTESWEDELLCSREKSQSASYTRVSVTKRSPWFLLPASASVASLGGILFGYDVGIISGAILLLREEFHLSCKQQEVIVTSLLIGGVVASFAGGQVLDRFGRKLTIIVNAFVFAIGALILTLSRSYPMFIAGRLILGFAVSLSAVADCVYISEIAPSNKRGLLVSLNELGITLGILFAYVVSYILFDVRNGWRYMFGVSIIPAALQALGMVFLPESPRWLITKGRETEATRLIGLLWPHLNAQGESHRLKESLSQESTYSIFDLFGKRENMRTRMLVGMGVILFQQLTGQPTVLYYAPALFKTLGFDQNVSATLATVGLGVVKVIATSITLCLVDKIGRRKFLLGGSIIMTGSLVILSALTFQNLQARPKCDALAGTQKLHTHFILPKYCDNSTLPYSALNDTLLQERMVPKNLTKSPAYFEHITSTNISFKNCSRAATKNDNGNDDLVNTNIPPAIKYLCLISLMFFVIGFAIGYGPMGWLVISEIFPTGIKGRAVAAATIANWGTNILLSMTFLELLVSVGTFWIFLIYAMIGVLSIVFLANFVPETKGKTLETISDELNQMIFPCEMVRCCRRGRIVVDNGETNELLQNDQRELTKMYYDTN